MDLPLWGSLLILSTVLSLGYLTWRTPAKEQAARRPNDDARLLVKAGGALGLACGVAGVALMLWDLVT